MGISRLHHGASHSFAYRTGATRAEVIFVLAIVVAGISVLVAVWPWPSHPDGGYRTPCAANLSGIGKALYTYANENADMFPIVRHAPAVELKTGRVAYAPGKIGAKRGDGINPLSGATTEADTELSTTRNLWWLIRFKAAKPEVFICPSSGDVKNRDNPQGFWDFRGWSETSYGYQVPYGRKGQPSTSLDAKMPLVADKGPYGAALEAGKSNPGPPVPLSTAPPEDWIPWNSANHGGDGQVVLFVDSHAEFLNKPTVGIGHDNIYTRWSAASGGSPADDKPCSVGTPPTSNETPWGDTDTLIYP